MKKAKSSLNIHSARFQRTDLLKYLFMYVLLFVICFPFAWMVVMSLKTDVELFSAPLALPRVPQWENYRIAFEKIDFLLFAKNTFILATCAVVCEVVFHFLAAFAICRLRFTSPRMRRMQTFFYYLFSAGLMIPGFIGLYPTYLMSARIGILDTYYSVFLPYVGGAVAFNSMLLIGSLRSFPTELEDAAMIDGCSLVQLIVRICAPISAPALATVIIWNFLGVWNEYPLAVVMINKADMRTLSLAASLFKSQWNTSYAGLTAGLVVLLVPQLLFYAFFQKYIAAGMMAGAIKG